MKNKLIIKGGYGEHGRSCFLIPFQKEYIMFDCGILDTDSNPYPDIDEEMIKNVKYIFISHCHKDHIGAFNHFVEMGFEGKIILTKATYELAEIEYDNVLFIDHFNQWISLGAKICFLSGRSGHCPGSVWFQVQVEESVYFYSGDYQEDTLTYLCDQPQGIDGNLAIIDLAHKYAGSAKERRGRFISKVKECILQDSLVILPMQKYGRGVEVLYQIVKECDGIRIKLDDEFQKNLKTILSYGRYLEMEKYLLIQEFIDAYKEPIEYDILFLGDAHLEQENNIRLIESIEKKKMVISTGRIKKGGYINLLYDSGLAEKYTYTHHQSIEDMEELLDRNRFEMVVPFHNHEKEILLF